MPIDATGAGSSQVGTWSNEQAVSKSVDPASMRADLRTETLERIKHSISEVIVLYEKTTPIIADGLRIVERLQSRAAPADTTVKAFLADATFRFHQESLKLTLLEKALNIQQRLQEIRNCEESKIDSTFAGFEKDLTQTIIDLGKIQSQVREIIGKVSLAEQVASLQCRNAVPRAPSQESSTRQAEAPPPSGGTAVAAADADAGAPADVATPKAPPPRQGWCVIA